MRLVLVHWVVEDRGSPQDIYNYTRVAKEMGHQVAIYGPPDPHSSFEYSRALKAADAVIFLFEWTTLTKNGDNLDFVRLVGQVPRERRIVVDLDGKYNDAISVAGDYNHDDDNASRSWVSTCDSLSDKIYQATPRPLRKNVKPFLFHAYNPAWEYPLDFSNKQFGMYLVGNNYFRWMPVRRMLQAVERVREDVGRIGFVGHGWDVPPPWTHPSLRKEAYDNDPEYLKQIGVEVRPPVHFSKVIEEMCGGRFHPVILRPLFDHLGLVTCRTFETLAANTIPLFTQDEDYVRGIYGEAAIELVYPEQNPEKKMQDIVHRPDYYTDIVRCMRQHLSIHHSYAARIRQLVEMVNSR